MKIVCFIQCFKTPLLDQSDFQNMSNSSINAMHNGEFFSGLLYTIENLPNISDCVFFNQKKIKHPIKKEITFLHTQ